MNSLYSGFIIKREINLGKDLVLLLSQGTRQRISFSHRALSSSIKAEKTQPPKKIWFRETGGLSFRCTACGKCCTGTKGAGKVWVNQKEREVIADELYMDVKSFDEAYITKDSSGQSPKRSLRTVDNRCIFLDPNTKQCSIYEVRPTQCRTYPFWPQMVVSPFDWKVAAMECEGIKVDDEQSLKNLGQDSRVSAKHVMDQVIVQSVHKSGEDMLYEDMIDSLDFIEQDTLEMFEHDLTEHNKRLTIYESDSILVQDNYFLDEEDINMSNREIRGPTRSLHFKSHLSVTQTEVLLYDQKSDVIPRSPQSLPIRHDRLVLDVHRAQYMAFGWIQPNKPLNVAIIGTGGGALPMYVLHHHQRKNESSPLQRVQTLDCVDASQEVLDVAKEYFGLQDTYPIRVICQMGEDYLPQNGLKLHVLIIDVAKSPENAESESPVLIAPPESLVSQAFLDRLNSDLMDQDDAIVVWNVVNRNTSELKSLVQKIQSSFPHVHLLALPNNYILFASMHPRHWEQISSD